MSIASDLATLGDGPTPGSPALAYLTSTRLAALVSAVRGLARGDNIQSGIGVIRKSVSGGVILSAKPAKGGGGGTAAVPSTAFDVSVTEVWSGETLTGYQLSVAPGTVNGILPENYSLTYTTSSPDTSVFLLLTATTVHGEVATCSLSFGSAVATQIVSNLGMPPATFAWTLGMLVAGKWSKLVNGSLMAVPAEVFRVAKASYVPGQLPYDAYYTWRLSTV